MKIRVYFSIFDPPYNAVVRGSKFALEAIPREDWQMGLTPKANKELRDLLWYRFPIKRGTSVHVGATIPGGRGEQIFDILDARGTDQLGKINSFFVDVEGRTDWDAATLLANSLSYIHTTAVSQLTIRKAVSVPDFNAMRGSVLKTAFLCETKEGIQVCASGDNLIYQVKKFGDRDVAHAKLMKHMRNPLLDAGTEKATTAFLKQLRRTLLKQQKTLKRALQTALSNEGALRAAYPGGDCYVSTEMRPLVSKPFDLLQKGGSNLLMMGRDKGVFTIMPLMKPPNKAEWLLFSELYVVLMADWYPIYGDTMDEFLYNLRNKLIANNRQRVGQAKVKKKRRSPFVLEWSGAGHPHKQANQPNQTKLVQQIHKELESLWGIGE